MTDIFDFDSPGYDSELVTVYTSGAIEFTQEGKKIYRKIFAEVDIDVNDIRTYEQFVEAHQDLDPVRTCAIQLGISDSQETEEGRSLRRLVALLSGDPEYHRMIKEHEESLGENVRLLFRYRK